VRAAHRLEGKRRIGEIQWHPRSICESCSGSQSPISCRELEQLRDDQLVYRLPRPQPDGAKQLRLTSLELIDRLATLTPPPRIHRHRYHGVLASNSLQRTQVNAAERGNGVKPAELHK
jgi:hypothetical protein